MKDKAKTPDTEWVYIDLLRYMKNAKISKKVFLVDRFRNAATLEAIRGAAMLQRGDSNAGFSIIDYINSIPNYITEDPQLKDSRRQLQHFKEPPAWRHATPELQAIFYQFAMLQQAEQSNLQLTPFTLNLTPDFVNKALQNKKGFIDYTKRQIDKSFLSVLSRKPQYWFIIELAPIGSYTKGYQRPHLHGGIITTQPERESIRKQKTPISEAFHKAVGKCHPDFSNRLLVTDNHKEYAEKNNISELEAVINWARYCSKDNGFKVRQFLNSKTNLTADNETKRQAEALYSLLIPKASKLSSIEEKDLEAFLSWN